LPLELLEDIVGQWLVEVRRDGELAGGQAVGAELVAGGWEWLDFRQRSLPPNDEQRLSRFHAPEEGKGITLDLLDADDTHGSIITQRSAGWIADIR
jgi:hypothetical protein